MSLTAEPTVTMPNHETPPITPAVEPRLTVVEPRTGFSLGDTGELWRYRELFYYLILRELKLRYKQTILGVGWSLFQPLATALVFVVFIGIMGKASEGIENYVVFVLLGVLPWNFFASAIQNAGNSLVANERLVTKVYFPRLLLPVSNIGSSSLDFCVGLSIVALSMIYYGVAPGWTIIFAPLVFLMLALTATGIGVLLAALIVAQRDFRYLLAFGVQLWMFATPCIYLTQSSIGPVARTILPLNPVYGLILNFRNLVLGTPMDGDAWYALGMSVAMGLTLLVGGLIYFRRVERTFADTI